MAMAEAVVQCQLEEERRYEAAADEWIAQFQQRCRGAIANVTVGVGLEFVGLPVLKKAVMGIEYGWRMFRTGLESYGRHHIELGASRVARGLSEGAAAGVAAEFAITGEAEIIDFVPIPWVATLDDGLDAVADCS